MVMNKKIITINQSKTGQSKVTLVAKMRKILPLDIPQTMSLYEAYTKDILTQKFNSQNYFDEISRIYSDMDGGQDIIRYVDIDGKVFFDIDVNKDIYPNIQVHLCVYPSQYRMFVYDTFYARFSFYINGSFNSDKLEILDSTKVIYDNTPIPVVEYTMLYTISKEYSMDYGFDPIGEYEICNANHQTVNVLHFPGERRYIARNIIKHFLDVKLSLPQGFKILTFYTDENKSPLFKQLQASNIPFVNLVPADYDHRQIWDNRDKIKYINDFFANEDAPNEYYLILDANDVVIQSFDGLIDKLKNSRQQVIYNADWYRYPNIAVEDMMCKQDDVYRNLNAGVCIGHRSALMKLYRKALDIHESGDIQNEFRSEQLIIRHAIKWFQDHDDQFVTIDSNCKLFFNYSFHSILTPHKNKLLIKTKN